MHSLVIFIIIFFNNNIFSFQTVHVTCSIVTIVLPGNSMKKLKISYNSKIIYYIMYNYMKINYFKNKSHDILTANELNALCSVEY